MDNATKKQVGDLIHSVDHEITAMSLMLTEAQERIEIEGYHTSVSLAMARDLLNIQNGLMTIIKNITDID